jgi:hypothetical protein
MSFAKPKRSKQNRSKSRVGKPRYASDRHRWRKFTATLLSILFFIPFSLSVGAHGAWFVWCVVTSIAILLWLAIVLLEWHVWKRTIVLGRIAVLLTCSALVVGGVKWQSKSQFPSPTVLPSPNESPTPKVAPTLAPTPSPIQAVTPSSQRRQPGQKIETASDHIDRARALLGREQLDAALVECKRALRLEPNNQTAIDLKNSINNLNRLQKTKKH